MASRRLGANVATLARLTNLNGSNIGRGHSAALARLAHDADLQTTIDAIVSSYNDSHQNRESQAWPRFPPCPLLFFLEQLC